MQILDNSGIATPAAVVPVVTVFVVGGVVIVLIMLYYQLSQSLIVIRFSGSEKPGTLAQILKVFKVMVISYYIEG